MAPSRLSWLALVLALVCALAPKQASSYQANSWHNQLYQSLEPMRAHQVPSPISLLTSNPFLAAPPPQMAPLVAWSDDAWTSQPTVAPVQEQPAPSRHSVSGPTSADPKPDQREPAVSASQVVDQARTPDTSKPVEQPPAPRPAPSQAAAPQTEPQPSRDQPLQQQVAKSELGELKLAHSGKILDSIASVLAQDKQPARSANLSTAGSKPSSAGYAKALTAANIALQVIKPRSSSNNKQVSVAALEQSIINQHSSGGANSFERVSNTQRLVPQRQRNTQTSAGSHFYSSELSTNPNRAGHQASLASLFENLISGVNSRSSIVKAMGDNRLARTLSNVGKTIGSNKYVAGAAAASALAALGLTVSKLFSPYAFSSKYSEPLLGSGSMPIFSTGYSADPDQFAPTGQVDSLHQSGSSQLHTYLPANSQSLSNFFDQPTSQFATTLSPIAYEPSTGAQETTSGGGGGYQPDYQTVVSGLQSSSQQQQQPADKVLFAVYQRQADQQASNRQQPFGYPTSGSDVGGYYGSYYSSPGAQSSASSYNPTQSYPDGYQLLTPNSNAANEQSTRQQATTDQMLASGTYTNQIYQWQPYGATQAYQPSYQPFAAPAPRQYSGPESGRRSGSVAIKLNQASRDKISQYLSQLQQQQQQQQQPATRRNKEPSFSAGSFVPIVSGLQDSGSSTAARSTRSSLAKDSQWLSVKSDEPTSQLAMQTSEPAASETSAAQQVQLVSVDRRHTEVSAPVALAKPKPFEDSRAQHGAGASYSGRLADQQTRQVRVSPKARLSRTTTMANKLASGFDNRLSQQQQQKPTRQREKTIDSAVGVTQIDSFDSQAASRAAGSQPEAQQLQQVESGANSSSILAAANEDFSAGAASSGADQADASRPGAGQELPSSKRQQFDGSEMNNGMRLVELGQQQQETRTPTGDSGEQAAAAASTASTNNQSPSGVNLTAGLGYQLAGQSQAAATSYFGPDDSIQEAPSSAMVSLSSQMVAPPDAAANLRESGSKQTEQTTTTPSPPPPPQTGATNKDDKSGGWEATGKRSPGAADWPAGKSSQLIEVVVAPQAGSLVLANSSHHQNQHQQAKIAANHRDKYQTGDGGDSSAAAARSQQQGRWPLNGYL